MLRTSHVGINATRVSVGPAVRTGTSTGSAASSGWAGTVRPAFHSGLHGVVSTALTVVDYQTTNMSEVAVKQEVITKFRTHEKDTGSPEVQIALLSQRITHLTEHLRDHRKDFHSRRGLLAMASRRRKLLDYLKSESVDRYNAVLQALGLRR